MLGFSFRRRSLPPDARTVTRHPFVQEPASTTLVNTERLPDAEKLRASEIAYRAQTLTDNEAQRFARRYLLPRLLLVPPLIFVAVILPLFVPISFFLVLTLCAGVTIVRSVLFGQRNSRAIRQTFFYPVAIAGAGELVVWALSSTTHPPLFGYVCLSICLVLGLILFLDSRGPFTFGWSWIATDPAIGPQQSRTYRGRGALAGLATYLADTGRSRLTAWSIPLATAAAVFVLGYFIVTAGLLDNGTTWRLWISHEGTRDRSAVATGFLIWSRIAACAICVAWLLWALRRGSRAASILGHYLTYDGGKSGAPGVWVPHHSLRVRRALLGAFLVVYSLTSFVFDGFLIRQAPAGKPYFQTFETLRVLDSAAAPATDGRKIRASLAENPPVENPLGIVIPPETASTLAGMSAVLRDPETAKKIEHASDSGRLPLEVGVAEVGVMVDYLRKKKPQPNGTSQPPNSATSSGSETTDTLPEAPFLEPHDGVLNFIAQAFGTSVGAIINRAASFSWLVLMSVLTVVPVLALLLLTPLLYVEVVGGFMPSSSETDSQRWAQLVSRVRSSMFGAPDPLTGKIVHEADHLFLGVEPKANFPVLLDQKLLGEHTYIVGDSGSGKTSLGIMPIVNQLMRGSYTHPTPAPILILDLKGDNALFHMTRELAQARGQNFLFFTPESGKDGKRGSHSFNPFQDFDRTSRSLSAFSTLFLDALSLNHGEGYGRGYYTARNRLQLFSIIEKHDPKNFQELYRHLGKLDRRAREDAFELVAVMQMLDSYKQLNPGPEIPQERVIHMRRLLQDNEVAYFWLPAAIESISVREIGKLALFSLISATIARQRDGQETKQVYVIVDEFQRLAGENFSILLEQARSFGISLILANQTISDLNTPSKDLRPSIRTNTRAKLFFSVTEPDELEALGSLSGQDILETRSRSVAKGRTGVFPNVAETEATSESLSQRLSAMDIQRISDHPNEFLLLVSRGSGFTQFGGLPVPVRTAWPMSESEYKRLSSLPWPTMPVTEREQQREGLTVELLSVKERERQYLAEAEAAKAAIAASVSGYAEVRFFPEPEDDAGDRP